MISIDHLWPTELLPRDLLYQGLDIFLCHYPWYNKKNILCLEGYCTKKVPFGGDAMLLKAWAVEMGESRPLLIQMKEFINSRLSWLSHLRQSVAVPPLNAPSTKPHIPAHQLAQSRW